MTKTLLVPASRRRWSSGLLMALGVVAFLVAPPLVEFADARLQYKLLRRALARERTNCSPEQVSDRDPKLAACYQAQDNDLRNGLPYTHYVFCGTTGRTCCQVDNRTNATSNCTSIDNTVKSRDAANPGRPDAVRPRP
jgi:hypothetical protein